MYSLHVYTALLPSSNRILFLNTLEVSKMFQVKIELTISAKTCQVQACQE